MRVPFAVKESLTEEEITEAMSALTKDGVATQIMYNLTGSVFLVGLAIKIGVPNYMIGILTAIPMFAQILQIFGVYLIEKVKNRRVITVYGSLLSRVFWLLVALVPVFFVHRGGFTLIFLAVLVNSIMGAIAGISWNSWIRDLIPPDQLGKFFSVRTKYATIFGMITSLVAAGFLDMVEYQYPQYDLQAYSVLFVLGFLAGVVGVYFLSKAHEPMLVSSEINLIQKFKEPFKDTNFNHLIRFSSAWNFALNLAVPFFTVYMLQRLNLEISWVIFLTILGEAMNVIFITLWGKFVDRFNNKSVLRLCGLLYLFTIFIWTFTTMPDRYVLTIPLVIILHIFMGIATSGVNLASSNIVMKLSPREKAPAYLATSSLINSVAASVAPIIGGSFIDTVSRYSLRLNLDFTTPNRELSFVTLDFRSWDFFFFFAFLIGLYAIHRLSAVEEIGYVGSKALFKHVLAEIRNDTLSASAVGLNHILNFPIFTVEALKNTGLTMVRGGSKTLNKTRDAVKKMGIF